MAKGRYAKKGMTPNFGSRTGSLTAGVKQNKPRQVVFHRKSFNVSESRKMPKIKRSVLGGYAFDARNAGVNIDAAGDVIQTSVEHFYSPLFPTDLLEKPIDNAQAREYYRHFYKRDPYVGRAIDLHCDLPISKIRLKLPDCKDKERARKILKFYEEMCRRLRLQKRLREIALEYWLFGGAWPFHEWDEENKIWKSINILNPDSLDVESYPYTDYVRVSIRPSAEDQLLLQQAQANPEDENLQQAIQDIPEDILARVENGENIPLDTEAYEGSFVHHFTRRKLSSDIQGVSILERVLDALIYRDKLRQAQSMIASRSMTPKNIVWAEGLSDPDVTELREQVDLAIADPDFSIVANYQITWDQIGASGRLLDMATEYDYTETLLTVGLGVTRELLTGEGTFSGSRIGLEVMNTSYMSLRDDFSEYVEECLFRPVAVANDFFEEDKEGNRMYIYPRLTFTRLALRDNVDTFDMLYNLYQKGSIDISVILDLLNIDATDTKDKLQRDIFTVNDSQYNELLRGIYQEAARAIVERTDITERIAKDLNLRMLVGAQGQPEGGAAPGGGAAMPPPGGAPPGGAPPGMEGMPPDLGGAPPGGGLGGPPPPPGGGPPAASVRGPREVPRSQNMPNKSRVVRSARRVASNNGLLSDGMRTTNGESLVHKISVSQRVWKL